MLVVDPDTVKSCHISKNFIFQKGRSLLSKRINRNHINLKRNIASIPFPLLSKYHIQYLFQQYPGFSDNHHHINYSPANSDLRVK